MDLAAERDCSVLVKSKSGGVSLPPPDKAASPSAHRDTDAGLICLACTYIYKTAQTKRHNAPPEKLAIRGTQVSKIAQKERIDLHSAR